jgi:hypothetical protein
VQWAGRVPATGPATQTRPQGARSSNDAPNQTILSVRVTDCCLQLIWGATLIKNWEIKIKKPISELFYILLALLLVDLTVSLERSPLVDT